MDKVATPQMFKQYQETLKKLLVDNGKEKRTLIKDRDAIFRLLSTYTKELQDTKWCIDKLKLLLNDDIKRQEIKDIKLTNLNASANFSNSDVVTLNDHLKHHIINLIYIIRELVDVNEAIDVLIQCKLRPHLFSKLLRTINFEATKLILGEGARFKLGNRLGEVYIVLLDANKGKRKVRKIDWGESLKTLEAIAKDKEETREILDSYKIKVIKKKQFIAQMKSYVYSEEHPNYPKWLVSIETDINPYWHWSRIKSNVKNKHLFSFTPTNFVQNESRSQLDFIKTAKSVNDIIDTNLLGCRDKVYALLRYDRNHEIYYKS